MLQTGKYKQRVASVFEGRSAGYDAADDIHRWLAERLVEFAGLRVGQRVLDVASGTGLVAILAAWKVGPEGRVLGVDLSAGMIEQARRKAERESLSNTEFRRGDIEAADFGECSFDAVLCSSAVAYMTEIPATLRKWRRWSASDGTVAFNCPGVGSFEASAMFRRRVREDCGIELPDPIAQFDTPEKCREAMRMAGFGEVEVKTERTEFFSGDATQTWETNLRSVFNREVARLPAEKLEVLRDAYVNDVELLRTERGIRQTIEAQFVLGRG